MFLFSSARIRIRIELKCWIQIRIQVNPDPQPCAAVTNVPDHDSVSLFLDPVPEEAKIAKR
jgi:hypothetical protein